MGEKVHVRNIWYTITWGPEHITHWFEVLGMGTVRGERWILYQGGWTRSFLRELVATGKGNEIGSSRNGT